MLNNNIIKNIKVTKTNKGKSQMTSGDKFSATLTYNGKSARFTFNDNHQNKSDKLDFLNALIIDANSYSSSVDLLDFSENYFENIKEAKKAYNECKKQYERYNRLFNEQEQEELQELFYNY